MRAFTEQTLSILGPLLHRETQVNKVFLSLISYEPFLFISLKASALEPYRGIHLTKH